ncbi:MAG: metal-dependent hydrolase [Acidimicrobiia bacterium]
MILWHIGVTILVVRYVFRDPKMDLRMLALGSLLPDLVDKPIGSVFFNDVFRSGRIFGHTLVFSGAVMVAVVLMTRRGTWARQGFMALAVGSLVHLLIDPAWSQAETFWWPLFGFDFPEMSNSSLGALLSDTLTDPLTWTVEALGLAYLVYLWRRAGLSDSGRRREFLKDGRIAMRPRG